MCNWYKIIAKIRAILFYPLCFASYGKKTMIIRPLQIDGMKNISIGNSTYIYDQTWLAAMPLSKQEKPFLQIGNNCVIGHFNHIYATNKIIIQDSVLTADKVYISDNQHEYNNPQIPIKNQPIRQSNPIVIGEGSWLGENVCILSASIGKHCVIGANSVVTHDIPDYSVVVGAPARVIKKYNFDTQRWEKIGNI